MSSVKIWGHAETGVAAQWNKGETFSVTAPPSAYLDPNPRRYPNAESAIRAARRLVAKIQTLPADWRASERT